MTSLHVHVERRAGAGLEDVDDELRCDTCRRCRAARRRRATMASASLASSAPSSRFASAAAFFSRMNARMNTGCSRSPLIG